MNNVGAQLYTVRDLLSSDEQTVETLKKIKALGYTAVQFFGGKDRIISMGKAAKETGLKVQGVLSDIKTYLDMGDELFELAKEYNIPDLGISSFITDEDEVKEFIKTVNEFAKKAKKRGFTFSYHNHANEFIRLPSGKTVMELLLEGFDPEYVDFMPDTYWLTVGGMDVRYFLEKTKGRVKILHLKDLEYTLNGPKFAEVGKGNLCFKEIIETAEKVGIREFAVEQDICDGDPLESLKYSVEYLKGV